MIEKERNRRVSQSEAHEEEVRRLQKIVNDFTADIRKITENRLKVLVDTGVSSVEASKQRWLAREAYKKDAIKRNDALRYLLQRSSDALIAVNTEEEDPKGKGKKGKGKK